MLRNRFVLLIAVSVAATFAFNIAEAAPIVPDNDPVNSWLFDEGAGANAADSGTVGGSDAGLSAGASWSSNTPFAYAGNNSLNTNGAGNAVASMPSAGSFAGPFTMSMWVSYNGTTAGNGNHFVFDTDGTTRQLLYFNDGTPNSDALYWNAASQGNPNFADLAADDWTHYALVSDGTNLFTYEDGALTDTLAVNAGAIGNFFFGSRQSSNEFWRGELDEFAMWNEALSVDNVEWLSQNSLNDLAAARVVPEPSSFALWGLLGMIGLGYVIWRRRAITANRM